MKRELARTIALIAALTLALGACSVAPRGRTVVVERTAPPRTAAPTAEGRIQFNLTRQKTLTTKNLDQAGYFDPSETLVFGWLDDDHLIAVGVKPIASDAQTDAETHRYDPRKAKIAGTTGLTGQILSLDWKTGETAELYTVQDEVIVSLGLSHDKTQLWYQSLDSEGMMKLSVSDISFKHSLLEIDPYYGYLPIWSSRDELLGYQSEKVMLGLFDGTQSRNIIAMKTAVLAQRPLGILDETGEVILWDWDGVLTIFDLQQSAAQPDEAAEEKQEMVLPRMEAVYEAAAKAEMAGNDILLSLSQGMSTFRLDIQNIRTLSSLGSYEGVLNFALSGDGQYICLVEEAEENSADIYVAEWNDGRIANKKLVYKGFLASGNICFSPDNSKLYLEGVFNYLDMDAVSLILEFE